MSKVAIYIEGERLDIFEDENIVVKSSVQNIKDITKSFDDYSQTFSVPGSKKNNRIFKNYWNFNINNGFDARIRHRAHLEVNGLPFKIGSIRLEGSVKRNNEVSQYRVTFFGRLIDLKKLLGEDYLSDLDYKDYEFDYYGTNVRNGLSEGLFGGDVVFPAISIARQWMYNSDGVDFTDEEKLVNIAYDNSGQTNGILWNELRPALKVMRIIEAIEDKYNITFSRDFFNDAAITDLYLWLANEDTEELLTVKYIIKEYNVYNLSNEYYTYSSSTGKATLTKAGVDNLMRFTARVYSAEDKEFTLQIMNGDEVLAESTGKLDVFAETQDPTELAYGAEIYIRVISKSQLTSYQASFSIVLLTGSPFFLADDGFVTPVKTANLAEFVPKIKTIDFLKWIFKSFNLVITPTGDNEFYVNTLDDWYNKGLILNVDLYIDKEEISYNRGVIYSSVAFKNEEPQTILANQFNKINNVAYGDLETTLKASNGENLDGGKLEITTGFEQMVYESLFDLNDSSETSIVYGMSLDDGLDAVLPKAHLLYILQLDCPDTAFVNESSTLFLLTQMYMPSHLSPDGLCTSTWGSEINEHTNLLMNNSLYSNYYEDYITDTFSLKRRQISVKARLPIGMLSNFKFNDRIVFDNNRFIVNSAKINLTSGETDLVLLNDIYGEVKTVTADEVAGSTDVPDPVVLPDGKSFSIASTGESINQDACVWPLSATKYFDGSTEEPEVGTIIYDDIKLQTPYNGGGLWRRFGAADKIGLIGNDGRVYMINVCKP